MADSSDRILKILIQLQSDIAGLAPIQSGVKNVKAGLDEASKSAFTLGDAFKFAGAEQALNKALEIIKEIPTRFEEGIKAGVEFNAELQNLQTSIAAVLQITQPNKFANFGEAKDQASEYIDTIKDKANELGIAYQTMFESIQHTQAQLGAAGVNDINKAIELTVTLNRAMQAVGTSSTQAARDIGDILQGQAARTLGGGRLAAAMGMSKEDMDVWIKGLIQTGDLYDGLTAKLAPFAKAATDASHNFNADSERMKNSILDLESELAKPMMAPLQEAMQQFTSVLKQEDVRAWADVIGSSIVQLTLGLKEAVIDITQLAEKYQYFLSLIPGVANVMQGVGALGAAHDSAVDVAQTAELQKQLDLTRQRVAMASTEGEKSVEWLGVVSLQAEVEQKINDEKAKGAAADQGILSELFGILDQVKQIRVGYDDIAGSAANAATATRAISDALQKVLDSQNLLHAETYGSEADIYKAKWVATYHAIADEAKKVGQQLTADQLNQLTYEKLMGPERLKELNATQRVSEAAKDVTDFTREQALLLTQIHNAQQVISANPFMSVDQKNAQSIPLMTSEIQTLNAEIAKGETLMHGGTLDPAQYDRVAQEVDNLRTKVQLLTFQLQQMSFGGTIQADLTKWANSFGTAATQVAGFLTGTLNTAISGTSQAITGLITGTKNWQQAFAQVIESIIQSLIRMALQFVISRLLMAAINRAMGTADSSAATTQASSAAAAWAPAATSASIASYGTAAGTGLAAYLAALASGVAGATALAGIGGGAGSSGFAEGGFTGGTPGMFAGIVHGGEFVFSAPAVQNIGVQSLTALHDTAKSASAATGATGPTGAAGRNAPHTHIAIVHDTRSAMKWLDTREGRKAIVDIARGGIASV